MVRGLWVLYLKTPWLYFYFHNRYSPRVAWVVKGVKGAFTRSKCYRPRVAWVVKGVKGVKGFWG